MENEVKQKCTNCKCYRIEADFIGKSGNIVKRCLKCREKDDKQKKRPDVIEKRNKRQNEKKYYIKYRENKREENEEEYLKRNAKNMRNWCENNKEHLAKWRTQNFTSRFYGIKQQAQKKGIIWDKNLTDEICYKMMISNCFYCNFVPDKSLNGIDRMDSMVGYEKSNTVSCCKNCNFMKGSLDPETFIKRCQHISKHFGGDGNLNKEVWSDSNSASYKEYIRRAIKKDLYFALTKEQFTKLTTEKCYYCDKENSESHKNGIDRKDNKIGYIIENCVSCCGQCNHMKGSLTEDKFIETCKRVSEYNLKNNIIIPKIDKCEYRIARREKPEISKEKIVITKQQPNKEKEVKEPIEKYIPKQRVYTKGSNLPEDYKIKADDIPKYCYYFKPTDKRGDGYCITRLHPKQKELGKDWLTTKSKKVSKKEKYKQMIGYLNDKIYDPKEDVIIEKTPNKECKQITPEDKFKLLDEKQLITVIKMKNKDKTTQEVSDYIKENYNIYINRNFISKLWLGEELNLSSDILNSSEYQDMKLNTKKKTVKSKKFNKEEIDWVLDFKLDKSLAERTMLFQKQFNKTISKEYVSKLSKS